MAENTGLDTGVTEALLDANASVLTRATGQSPEHCCTVRSSSPWAT